MEKVKSADGTLIAYEKTGEGPPLVLIHGAVVDHTHWEKILPKLAEHFTVYAIDRRGRGQSGDADEYRLELEYDDAAAVIDMINEPVILLGHSYGGLIAQEVALRTKNLRKLILYEPSFINGGEEYYDLFQEAIDKIESSLREGEYEQALLFLLENLLELSSDEIDIFRETIWNKMVNAVPALSRELKAIKEYKFEAARFKDLPIPTMLLSGSESLLPDIEVIKTLDKSLPESTITTLEDQAHIAMTTAPELFAEKVIKFA